MLSSPGVLWGFKLDSRLVISQTDMLISGIWGNRESSIVGSDDYFLSIWLKKTISDSVSLVI